jgi:hypothetical protein
MTSEKRRSTLGTLKTGAPPKWIELEDTAESDRSVYYNPVEEKVQWEPVPEDGVEKFSEEDHWQWRVPSSVVSFSQQSNSNLGSAARGH